jgi:hypothetical protein
MTRSAVCLDGQSFADNYRSPAHNQINQKVIPLPIFDNSLADSLKQHFFASAASATHSKIIG